MEVPYLRARRRLLPDDGGRWLDAGCGEGTFAASVAGPGREVVGVDLAEHAVRRARAAHPALEFVRGDVQDLPFEDNAFDVALACEVLEHVPDTAAAWSELRRVLKPRGRLLVTTPRAWRLPRDPRDEHLRFYTRRSLRALFTDFGFAEVEVRGLTHLSGVGRR